MRRAAQRVDERVGGQSRKVHVIIEEAKSEFKDIGHGGGVSSYGNPLEVLWQKKGRSYFEDWDGALSKFLGAYRGVEFTYQIDPFGKVSNLVGLTEHKRINMRGMKGVEVEVIKRTGLESIFDDRGFLDLWKALHPEFPHRKPTERSWESFFSVNAGELGDFKSKGEFSFSDEGPRVTFSRFLDKQALVGDVYMGIVSIPYHKLVDGKLSADYRLDRATKRLHSSEAKLDLSLLTRIRSYQHGNTIYYLDNDAMGLSCSFIAKWEELPTTPSKEK
jgi:hypothetical protein